ncbi:MAG: DUF4123 domain-containing protein [Rhizobacter sp.]
MTDTAVGERRERLKRADRLEALLFSTPSSVFAVLDAARDTGVVPLLATGDCPYACLYKGQSAATFAAYAPYLVQLLPDSAVAERLLQDAWGTSVGYFLGSSLDGTALCHHLRHFLYATLPDGRKAYFRFYDPRVMRAFLPTSSLDQLDDFLREAIDWFVIEGANADTAQVFSRVQGAQGHEPRLASDVVSLSSQRIAGGRR